jgi:uncharacterized RDD family membrane protein YckC
MHYASFWLRAAAFILDGVLLAMISMLVVIGDDTPGYGETTLSIAIDFVVAWAYFVTMTWKKKATLGKMIMGLEVVDAEGNNLSFIQANVRFFSTFISGALPPLYLVVAFNEKRRAIHDFIAGSYVIDLEHRNTLRQIGIIVVVIVIAVMLIWLMPSFFVVLAFFALFSGSGDTSEGVLSRNESVLHQYHATPCENKTYTVDREIVLLENGRGAMSNIIYGISRRSFDVYDGYRSQEGISFRNGQAHFLHGSSADKFSMHSELKLYPVGSRFKILTFYKIAHRGIGRLGGEGLGYYMVRSLEDNQTAWIPAFEMDSDKCGLATNHYHDSRRFVDDIVKNYSGVLITGTSAIAPKYSPQDEVYAISKSYLEQRAKNKKTWTDGIRSFSDADTLTQAHRLADAADKRLLLLHVTNDKYLYLTKTIVEKFFLILPQELRDSYVKYALIESVGEKATTSTHFSPTFYIYENGSLIDSFSAIDCQAYRDTLDPYSCYDPMTFGEWLKRDKEAKVKVPLPGFTGSVEEARALAKQKEIPLGIFYIDGVFEYKDMERMLTEIKMYPQISSEQCMLKIAPRDKRVYHRGYVTVFDKYGEPRGSEYIKSVVDKYCRNPLKDYSSLDARRDISLNEHTRSECNRRGGEWLWNGTVNRWQCKGDSHL